jgi:DNA helicase-2/ATP-dependent DNA helicase PcrA
VKLEQNYRSTRAILAAAQGVIRHNTSRKEKDLWTDKQDVALLQVLECGDENDEADEIAAQIHGLRNRGTRPDEIAIFYRVNFMQRALERALRLAGIPYQIVGGVEFYQRKEIRDLTSYLQLAVNPKDDVACARVLNVPTRGVGAKSAAQLAEWAQARGVSLAEAVLSEEARAGLRGRARGGVAAFAELLGRLRDVREQPAELALDFVIEEIDYFGWLSASGAQDGANREENVEELRVHAASYDKENPDGRLAGFLQDVALVSDVDAWDENEARVTLMTLHSSKGLVFPGVFVAGVEEELLPHALARADAEDDETGVEEERRLVYVGMTRARERLYLTWARMRLHFGETSWRMPSRFLAEIPAELVEGGMAAAAEEDAEELLGAFDADEHVVDLREGDRVEHDHFGAGYVARLQGAGANARVTVDFDHVGSKILLLQYAKLRVLGR